MLDDVPPLEDMSELLNQASQIRIKNEHKNVKGNTNESKRCVTVRHEFLEVGESEIDPRTASVEKLLGKAERKDLDSKSRNPKPEKNPALPVSK